MSPLQMESVLTELLHRPPLRRKHVCQSLCYKVQTRPTHFKLKSFYWWGKMNQQMIRASPTLHERSDLVAFGKFCVNLMRSLTLSLFLNQTATSRTWAQYVQCKTAYTICTYCMYLCKPLSRIPRVRITNIGRGPGGDVWRNQIPDRKASACLLGSFRMRHATTHFQLYLLPSVPK